MGKADQSDALKQRLVWLGRKRKRNPQDGGHLFREKKVPLRKDIGRITRLMKTLMS